MVDTPKEDERDDATADDGTSKTSMPHDGLFVDGMSRPQVYLEFFDEKLPDWLKAAIVPNSIEPVDGTLIDRSLRKLLTDSTFQAQFQWPDGRKETGYLKILVEHFSHLPANAVLRLFRYLFETWATWKKLYPDKMLPFIYPMICYTGKTKKPTVKALFELVDAPNDWLSRLFSQPIQMVNVGEDTPDEKGRDRLHLRIFIEAFKLPLMVNPNPTIIFELFAELVHRDENNGWTDFFMIIARYIIQVTDLEPAYLKQEAETRINQRAGEVFMSTADRLLDQGKMEGKKEGKMEGLGSALLMLLSEKFTDVPEWVYEKVDKATPEAVSQWLIRVLSREKIQDVFT